MAYTEEALVTYINGKTGLDRRAIKVLVAMTPAIRTYLKQQLLLLVTRVKNEKNKTIFSTLRGNVSINALNSTLSAIDTLVDNIDRIYNLNPFGDAFPARIPWGELAEESESFARLLDILKNYMSNVDEVNLGTIKIPGLSGVNSVDELKRRRDELRWRVQQATNVKTYAGMIAARTDKAIREIMVWINSIELIETKYQNIYTFTGNISVAGDFSTISWTDGTLAVNENTYTILADSISSLSTGVNYVYYDMDGAVSGFQSTSGALESVAGTNVRIAKVTVYSNRVPLMELYGKVNY